MWHAIDEPPVMSHDMHPGNLLVGLCTEFAFNAFYSSLYPSVPSVLLPVLRATKNTAVYTYTQCYRQLRW